MEREFKPDDTTDPRYKEGDEVWHITEKRKYLFYCYTYVSDNCKLSLGANKYTRSLSDIEPYTGQDKPILDRIKEMHSEPMRIVPVYPYTVILKSGKMIGITEQGGKPLIKSRESLQGEPLKISQSATLQLGDVLDFTNGEIAAIVPTENLML